MTLDIANLRKLLDAATPGPWTREKPRRDADGWAEGTAVAGTPGRQTIYARSERGSYPSADCDLIVAMRNALPALLDEVERLRDESLRFYLPDGTYETMGSAEEVVARRKSAASEIERLRDEVETLHGMEAQRDACEQARIAAEVEIARMREIEGEELREARDALLREGMERDKALAELREALLLVKRGDAHRLLMSDREQMDWLQRRDALLARHKETP